MFVKNTDLRHFRVSQILMHQVIVNVLNSFQTNVSLLFPLNASGNQRFSEVFQGVQKWEIGFNGLTRFITEAAFHTCFSYAFSYVSYVFHSFSYVFHVCFSYIHHQLFWKSPSIPRKTPLEEYFPVRQQNQKLYLIRTPSRIFPGNQVKLFRAAIFQCTETLVNTKVNRSLPVASK